MAVKVVALVLVGLLLAGPVFGQTTEPMSVGIAAAGIVVMGAGVGMMLHQKPCYYQPDQTVCGGSDPGWLVGGVAVMAAGVVTVWLGLRPRRVVVAPAVGRHAVGVRGVVTWR